MSSNSTAHSGNDSDMEERVVRSTITLHDHGDVTLLIGTGEEQQPVFVSKGTMQLASPIWRAMFDGPWSENQADMIPFPDDDVDAMLLVLRIAHLRFHEIRENNKPSIDQVFQLAIT
ncbi:hypothetical protein P154DRAFT_571317 [Amniculicola lignicola CBS 123094]|uniref:BTB domain-containing protein n=1 Tax=Amniculicola lignicola CBS 123094 TaxID=1392246 RepID=A0A6A5WTG5_9PLEO|nr:hypothetical protein P154DRAFT_571317 [Amniculicola lignicola CBS 123094]